MSDRKELIGERFGRLEVIEYSGRNKRNRKTWLCQCECGKTKIITQDDLKSGRVNSCGCLRKETTAKLHQKDLEGMKFGEWTVLDKIGSDKNQNIKWRCRCSCGYIGEVITSQLISGQSKCCKDCSYRIVGEKNKKHGMSRDRIYRIYCGIKNRCYNKNNSSYEDYGGRGIRVCQEWLDDFMNFYNWAIANGYRDDLTIDRIDVNGNYEPSNCRWVTQETQCNNKRDNTKVTYKGETKTITQWARELDIHPNTLYSRIEKLDWDIDKAFSKKPRKYLQNT